MKIFISVPMRDKTNEEIVKEIESVKTAVKNYLRTEDSEIIFVDNFIEKPENSERLYCLGEAIKKIGECDAVAFHKDYWKYPGCMSEWAVALNYGIKIYDYDNHGNFGFWG